MVSCRRNDSLPPSAASVTSVKTGFARGWSRATSAVHSTTCQPDGVAPPGHLPVADVLDAPGLRPGPDDVVADRGAEARGRIARPRRGSIEVIRNSATATSRTSLDRAAGARRRTRAHRASRSRRQILRSRDLELRLARSRLPAGSSLPPRNPGVEQRPGNARQACRSTSEGVGQLAQAASSSVPGRSSGNASVPGSTCSRKGATCRERQAWGDSPSSLVQPRAHPHRAPRRERSRAPAGRRRRAAGGAPSVAAVDRFIAEDRLSAMLADSDSSSTWRRSAGSCFHRQRRPPGIRTSTSTGPA